jgi:hypothetical protein
VNKQPLPRFPYVEADMPDGFDREAVKGPVTVIVTTPDGRQLKLINAIGRIVEPPPPLKINGRVLKRPPAPLRVRWECEAIEEDA